MNESKEELRAAAEARVTKAARDAMEAMKYATFVDAEPTPRPYVANETQEEKDARARAMANDTGSLGIGGSTRIDTNVSHKVISTGVVAPTTVFGTEPFSEEARAAAKERVTPAAQQVINDILDGKQKPVLPIVQPYYGPVDEEAVAAAREAAQARITPAAAATIMSEEEAAAASKAAARGKKKFGGILKAFAAATSRVIDTGVVAPTTPLGTKPFTEEERAAAAARITRSARESLDKIEAQEITATLPIVPPFMGESADPEGDAALLAAAKARITVAAAETILSEEAATAASKAAAEAKKASEAKKAKAAAAKKAAEPAPAAAAAAAEPAAEAAPARKKPRRKPTRPANWKSPRAAAAVAAEPAAEKKATKKFATKTKKREFVLGESRGIIDSMSAALSSVIDSGVVEPTTPLGTKPFTEEERAAAAARITAAAQESLDKIEAEYQTAVLPIVQPYYGPSADPEGDAERLAAAKARITPAAAETIMTEEEAAAGIKKTVSGAKKVTKASSKQSLTKIGEDNTQIGDAISAAHGGIIETGVVAPVTMLGATPFTEDAIAAAKARVTPAAQASLDKIASGQQDPVLPIVQPYYGPVDEEAVAAAREAAQARITPAAAATIISSAATVVAAAKKKPLDVEMAETKKEEPVVEEKPVEKKDTKKAYAGLTPKEEAYGEKYHVLVSSPMYAVPKKKFPLFSHDIFWRDAK